MHIGPPATVFFFGVVENSKTEKMYIADKIYVISDDLNPTE